MIPSSAVNDSTARELSETITVALGGGDSYRLLYNFRFTDLGLVDICNTTSTSCAPNFLYSTSLRALVMLVDTNLGYKTKTNKGMRYSVHLWTWVELVRMCNFLPEFHFEELESQLEGVRTRIQQTPLSHGTISSIVDWVLKPMNDERFSNPICLLVFSSSFYFIHYRRP